jgi:hypothetical protein
LPRFTSDRATSGVRLVGVFANSGVFYVRSGSDQIRSATPNPPDFVLEVVRSQGNNPVAGSAVAAVGVQWTDHGDNSYSTAMMVFPANEQDFFEAPVVGTLST